MRSRIAEWRDKVKAAHELALAAERAKPSAYCGKIEVFPTEDFGAEFRIRAAATVPASEVPRLCAYLIATWGTDIPADVLDEKARAIATMIARTRPFIRMIAGVPVADEAVQARVQAGCEAWLKDCEALLGPEAEPATASAAVPELPVVAG